MKKILAYLRRKIYNIWEPLQRNIGEEPLPYKDAHADHVIVKKK